MNIQFYSKSNTLKFQILVYFILIACLLYGKSDELLLMLGRHNTIYMVIIANAIKALNIIHP
jgi:hypothetical protein